MGRRGSRSILQAVARPVLRRDVRRLFRARQPGVADGARILGRGDARVPVHGLRAPGRSGGHRSARCPTLNDWRTRHRLREPLPGEGRLLQAAAVDVGAIHPPGAHLRRRARRDRSPGGRGSTAAERGTARATGRGARGGARARRAGDRGQGRVPRQHEPRDSHADERHHRHDGSDAADPADAAAARVHPHGAGIGRVADDHHRRHPRCLEDRGAPADARARAVSLPRYGRRQRQAARAARRSEGPGPLLPYRARRTRRAPRRRGPASAGPPQPGGQRHQVHRRRRGRRQRLGR